MEKLLEFVDRLCIDERLYWRVGRDGAVPESGQPGNIEVAWERQARPAAWKVRRPGDAEWTQVTTRDLAVALEAVGADQVAFERQLGASILTQAVFADMVLEGAERLFGHDVVQRSIKDTRAFLASVSDAAQEMTKAAGDPGRKLRLISRS